MDGYNDTIYNSNADKFIDFVWDEVEIAVDKSVTSPQKEREKEKETILDVSSSSGVLNIETTMGTFVINKQAPKRQLWYSSPISGPAHYDMGGGEGSEEKKNSENENSSENNKRWDVWVHERDGHFLLQRLQDELGSRFGVELNKR